MTKLDKTVKNLILEPQKLIQAIQNLISIHSGKTIQPGVRRVELCDVFVEGCYHPSPIYLHKVFLRVVKAVELKNFLLEKRTSLIWNKETPNPWEHWKWWPSQQQMHGESQHCKWAKVEISWGQAADQQPWDISPRDVGNTTAAMGLCQLTRNAGGLEFHLYRLCTH